MTQSGFHPFVVLTTQRTGSSWLIDALNRVEGIEAHQELFLPLPRREPPPRAGCNEYPRYVEHHTGGIRPFRVFGYLDELYRRGAGVGFKLMYSQLRWFPEIPLYLAARRVRLIHLLRENFLDVIISSEIARKSGRAHVTADAGDEIRVRLDPASLLGRIGRLDRNMRLAKRILRLLPCPKIEVKYEDLLRDPAVFIAVCRFLAPAAPAAAPASTLVKRQHRTHFEVVENYPEVKEILERSPWRRLIGPEPREERRA